MKNNMAFTSTKLAALRLTISIIILIVFLLLIHYAPKLSVALVAIIFICIGLLGSFTTFKSAKWISKWQCVRILRVVRRASEASPTALALYLVCFALSGAVLLSATVSDSVVPITIVSFLSGTILCIATLIDWFTRLNYVLTFNAGKNVAKVILGFIGTGSIFLSNIFAGKLAHNISHVDPAAMPEFVRLASVFYFPFALSTTIAIFLTLVFVVQYLILSLGFVVAIPVRYIVQSLPNKVESKISSHFYRLVHGKKMPKNRPWWSVIISGSQYILRPLGTGAITILVIYVGFVMTRIGDYVSKRHLQTLLIGIQFHGQHLCENVPSDQKVAYLSGGYISTVVPLPNDEFSFHTLKCHK